MKNKSIMVFATLMLFTACSNTKTLTKKEVEVSELPPIPVLEALVPPPGSNGSSLPPRYYKKMR